MSDASATVNVRFIPREDVSATLRGLMKGHAHFYWAVAWGSENPALAELLRHRSKIETLVIGTSFYQTPPAFLERFKGEKAVRVIAPDGATFHPKAYLFISDTHAAALVGSANFTKSAMESNAEACCLIEGTTGDQFFRKLKAFVAEECWNDAKAIDDEFLRSYRLQHEATKSARAALRKFVPLKRPKNSSHRDDPLEMDWPTFVARVRQDKSFQDRLGVLAAAKTVFSRAGNFAGLEPNERKAIAATLGKHQPRPQGLAPDLDWGMFGSMVGFGIFKGLIHDDPQSISDALDCIPPTGAVNKSDYDRFVSNFRKAFAGKPRKGGVPSASRLLAMKRPDYFVCFDTRNRRGLSDHFGVAADNVNLDTYWTDLVEPITLSFWWRTPRPRGTDGRIWDGRAAFLDSLYYEEP
jgi:hypothetical protein